MEGPAFLTAWPAIDDFLSVAHSGLSTLGRGGEMKNVWILVLVLLASFAFAGTTKISGTVVDNNGVPVPHFTIEAIPLDMSSSGGIDRIKTDGLGHFAITVPNGRNNDGSLYGQRWLLYPHQEKDYYPDISSAFYATGKSHAQKVQLTPEMRETTVEIKLGPKAGALTGHVTDSLTGVTLNPEFEFAWASGDPRKRMGVRTGDPYRILLPADTNIKLIVQCEGHKPWTYPGTIKVGPGQDMTLDIKLEPLPVVK